MTVAPAQAGAQPAEPDPRLHGDDGARTFVRTFPCNGCGAKLSFAPGTRELRCESCGTTNAIAENDARVEELDLASYLEALEGGQDTVEQEMVRCEKCGAEQVLRDHKFAATCDFCTAPIVSKSYAGRRVRPKAIIPFQVDRSRAQDAFRKWVAGLWLAPKELKRYAQTDASIQGLYLPFWTYDCRTDSTYTGDRGEHYYENESYTAMEAGKSVVRTRRVQRTRWHPVSGQVQHFHDDVLVLASNTLPHSLRGAVSDWKLAALQPYQPEFVSGYHAEAYQVDLKAGYPIARQAVDAQVHTLIRRQIGGDTQRVREVSTRYSDIKFKHVLLPAWLSAYRFRDKTYRFLVNGQTGDVAGESPLSWFRVGWLVAAVVVFFVLVYLFSR